MDSLTHIALGACIGELFLGRRLGRKGMLWGALAQSVPDLDVVSALWTGPTEHLLAHRGFTHSFLFVLLATPLLALIAARWHRPHDIPLRRFLLFFGVEMSVHVLLDALNNYGTGWLEPFSHHRFMANVIYVADPFFALAPGVATVVLAVRGWRRRWRVLAPVAALSLSGLYLGYCGLHAWYMRHEVHDLLSRQGVPTGQLLVTPTPLNNWLWYVVACDADSCRVGFRSVFDGDAPLRMHAFARNDHLLDGLRDQEDVRLLLRFSQGYYTVERTEGRIVFNDLRFGQVNGWADPEGAFVFHWSLGDAQDRMAVQRGRLTGWDRQSLAVFVRRMFGAQVGSER